MKEFVFVHIPKTGGASLRIVIDKNNLPIKIIKHNIKNPNYQSLEDYLRNVMGGNNSYDSKTLYRKPYVFTFVRNPWDRVVSAFHYLNNGGNNSEDEKDRIQYLRKYNGDFNLFIREAFINDNILTQLHFRPQHTWISDSNMKILADFIGRYEYFLMDIKNIERILSIKFGKIPVSNKSKRAYYRNYYNLETKNIIYKTYQKDIELFKYRF